MIEPPLCLPCKCILKLFKKKLPHTPLLSTINVKLVCNYEFLVKFTLTYEISLKFILKFSEKVS